MTLFLNFGPTLLCLLGGIIFGFLLRKAAVSRFDTIVGQLLLKDFTVMKVILTAIVVGSIGIYSLNAFSLIPFFHLAETPIIYSIIGGSLFGVGMSLAGYCPGTAIAAIAEGSKDMIFGLVGMLMSAALFSAWSPHFMSYFQQKDLAFQKTISSFFSIPNWIVITCLSLIWMAFAFGVRRLEQNQKILQEG